MYLGMQVYLTHNVRKDIDFVNGMTCVVTGWDGYVEARPLCDGGCLRVDTSSPEYSPLRGAERHNGETLRVKTRAGYPFGVWQWTNTGDAMGLGLEVPEPQAYIIC